MSMDTETIRPKTPLPKGLEDMREYLRTTLRDTYEKREAEILAIKRRRIDTEHEGRQQDYEIRSVLMGYERTIDCLTRELLKIHSLEYRDGFYVVMPIDKWQAREILANL